jgi:uncharacterized protein YuzE
VRVTYDREARALYAYLSEQPVCRTSAISTNCLIDYAKDGTVRGVELLGVDLDDITDRAAQAATREDGE